MALTLTEMLLSSYAKGEAGLTVHVAADRSEKLPYPELVHRALQRLTQLRQVGMSNGSYCILYLYDEVAFLECFWACVLGGIIPVPVAPGNTPEHKNKLFLVARDLGSPFMITESDALRRLEQKGGMVSGSAQALLESAIEFAPLAPQTPPADPIEATPDQTAYIQFSSGSTRTPRGVVLSHRNLVANIGDLSHAFGLAPDASTLSWMPLTHDMGLIGFHLCPIYAGIDQHLLRTTLFIRRPLAWLDIAARVGATTIGSPNFGYRHWLQAQEKAKAPLPDLSKIRQIINGAEPIDLDSVASFVTQLAPGGLNPGAMCPSYGLAEASLGIAVSPPGPGARAVWVDRGKMRLGQPVRIVGFDHAAALGLAIEGPIFPASQLRIANAEGHDLGEGVLGEIQIRGENVTSGYLDQPEANAELFTADGWLRTSDLGFLHAGELVVTGRQKDVIINNGQNYFAHDIELMVEHAGLAMKGEAAAGVTRQGDQQNFVLFLRTRMPAEGFDARARKAREVIYRTCGLTVAQVVPVRNIPKTTSGKIQRAALVLALESGALDEQPTAAEDPASIKKLEMI